jgi:hypothetical protein
MNFSPLRVLNSPQVIEQIFIIQHGDIQTLEIFNLVNNDRKISYGISNAETGHYQNGAFWTGYAE